jgi:hypothetical protein
MHKIPEQIFSKIESHPLKQKCMRKLLLNDHDCDGRITLEHAIIYAEKQVNEVWAIVFACAKSHSVDEFQDNGLMDKRIHEWIAINRMTPEDMAKYPRCNWLQKKNYLNSKYGDKTLLQYDRMLA